MDIETFFESCAYCGTVEVENGMHGNNKHQFFHNDELSTRLEQTGAMNVNLYINISGIIKLEEVYYMNDKYVENIIYTCNFADLPSHHLNGITRRMKEIYDQIDKNRIFM